MRTLAVLLFGLLAGVALSVLRRHLEGEFRPLVDSASAFLLAPCILGALMRTRRGAGLAGLGCAMLQLGGWAGCSALRGDPLGSSLVLGLLACGLIGAPLLAAAAQLARRGTPQLRGLGGAAIAAVPIAEGAWRDLYELHARTIGWLSIAVGLTVAAVLLARPRRVRWLAATLPLALLGEIALTRIYR